jgi:DNA repair protein RadC
MEDIRYVSDSELIYNISAKADARRAEGQTLDEWLDTLTPSRRKIAKSAIELYKRDRDSEYERERMNNSMAVYNYMYNSIATLPTEEFWVIYLNRGARVICRERISAGGISGTVVDVRCLLRGALLHRATCMVVCHNHPSGQARPSIEDDSLTQRLSRAAKTMDIQLVDHVIITAGNFYSYADEGKMNI